MNFLAKKPPKKTQKNIFDQKSIETERKLNPS